MTEDLFVQSLRSCSVLAALMVAVTESFEFTFTDGLLLCYARLVDTEIDLTQGCAASRLFISSKAGLR